MISNIQKNGMNHNTCCCESYVGSWKHENEQMRILITQKKYKYIDSKKVVKTCINSYIFI